MVFRYRLMTGDIRPCLQQFISSIVSVKRLFDITKLSQ